MIRKLKLSLIAAMGENRVIGSEGILPDWKLIKDMAQFVRLTKEWEVVIVGRKTHESIVKKLGRPLPGRTTVILTRKLGYKNPDPRCIVVSSWEDALQEAARLGEKAIVIGGAKIYALALTSVTTMYLTQVHGDFEGNTLFPAYNEDEWEITSREEHSADGKNSHAHTFLTLTKKGFVELDNARIEEQRAVMEEIEAEGVCPFCPEHLSRFHTQPTLRETDRWILTKNQWPYKNTRVHLLAIHRTHAERLADLTPEAWSELLELVQWAEQKFDIIGGGIGIRFGDPRHSSGTVRHLHVQFISADITDRDDPNYIPVRFRVG